MVNKQVTLWARCLRVSVIIVLTLVGTAMGEVSRDGLVAEWHFDGNARDLSGNGIDGIVYGASFVEGKFGKALLFNGVRDYADFGEGGGKLDFGSGPFSIEFWMNYKGTTGYQQVTDIMGKTIANANTPGYLAWTTTWGGDGSNYGLFIETSTGSWHSGNVEDWGKYLPNTWYHVVFVRDGNTWTIYKDGSYSTSETKSDISLSVDNNVNFKIGDSTSENNFSGIIDEVYIYNRALSATEVKGNYEAGQIIITSSPSGAEVLLDGVSKGSASPSLSVYGLSPSIYTVKCKLSGFSDYDTTATVAAGTITQVICSLPKATGSISVSSSPSGASIYLDGGYQGTTPFTITNVAAGSHTITLKLTDYQEWSQTINVVEGQAFSVSTTLTPMPGSILISSSPSGASIYLNGSYQGKTPFTITNVVAGLHTIALKLTDYQDWSRIINVAAGQTSSVSASLTSITVSISVSSIPSGADVYLDGNLKGTTPTTISDVPQGEHKIKLRKIDYYDSREIPVTATAEKIASVSETLIHEKGSLKISVPTGADIYLDDEYKGKTPVTLTDIPTGPYILVIKKFGYADYSQNIQIKTDEISEVSASMNLAPGIKLVFISMIILFIIGIGLLIIRKKPRQDDPNHVTKQKNDTVMFKEDKKDFKTAGRILRGKYEIIKLLKSGGMGYVYEGKYNGNKCVIKQPKSGKTDEETKYFFEKLKFEAEVLRKISHDNIVGYIDSFQEGNSFFLVEKYLEGEKIGDKYLNNPGSEEEVISYTLQLLDAVKYLHNKQIKHRDINPNNLILTSEKKLVLIDFGTAKFFSTQRKEVKSLPKSTKVGTPYYAPPEQWEGDTSEVSDIFSIGRTMYFMITGENPTENPYRRLDFLGKEVSIELADFITKAAEPEIKDRFVSAVQMINSLNMIKDGVNKTIIMT